MSTITLQPPVVRQAPRRPDYRLTRRGRLLVVVLALVAAVAVSIVLASGSVATDRPGEQVPTETVVVGPGDSLWSIASGATDGDVRDVMTSIERLNALDSGVVVVGQALEIPLD